MDWINDVKIIDYDRDIIAAFSEEEARQMIMRDSGFSYEEAGPEGELDKDKHYVSICPDVAKEERLSNNVWCPKCGHGWRIMSFRELLKSMKPEDLPCYIAGRD